MTARPLTPGEIVDLAGLRLTKAQARRARRELERMGYRCHERSDGQIVALPAGSADTEAMAPRFDLL